MKAAKARAVESINGFSVADDAKVLDDGEFYIFSFAGDADIPLIGVDKETGDVSTYFPPDHDAYLRAVEVDE